MKGRLALAAFCVTMVLVVPRARACPPSKPDAFVVSKVLASDRCSAQAGFRERDGEALCRRRFDATRAPHRDLRRRGRSTGPGAGTVLARPCGYEQSRFADSGKEHGLRVGWRATRAPVRDSGVGRCPDRLGRDRSPKAYGALALARLEDEALRADVAKDVWDASVFTAAIV